MAKVTFSQGGAKRIAAATLAYERGNRDVPPIKFRQVGGDDFSVRLGKTTGVWSKGALATIQLYENGIPPNESSGQEMLENCVNKFANVAGNKWVIVAQAGNGYYYLIAAECA